jgi:hypothetical protein
MSCRIGLPVRVETNAAGEPVRFTWRGRVYAGEVIGRWHLSARWWDLSERQADRLYYRLLTADHQMFELYRESTSAGLWVLDVMHD